MLIKDFIETREDGHSWYDLHSDTEGKAVLQKETGDIYGAVMVEHASDRCFSRLAPSQCGKTIRR